MEKNFIPENLYRKIVRLLPICCVDIVIVNKKRFLLTKRIRPPFKNQWWLPGGRILFGESLIPSAKRKLREELGIRKIRQIKFLGVGENKYQKKGYFNLPSHTINLVFLAEIDDVQAKNINLDLRWHSDYQWLKIIPKKAHSYLKKFLKLSGFRFAEKKEELCSSK